MAAFQLAEVLYKGHKKYAIEAVRLNTEHRVEDALIQTLDLAILLTGMIQTLAKGTLFTSIAHPLHNGMTLMKESHNVLHGLKVGYGIVVQLIVEKCPKKEFEDVLSFFRAIGFGALLEGPEPALRSRACVCALRTWQPAARTLAPLTIRWTSSKLQRLWRCSKRGLLNLARGMLGS